MFRLFWTSLTASADILQQFDTISFLPLLIVMSLRCINYCGLNKFNTIKQAIMPLFSELISKKIPRMLCLL